MNSNVFSGGWSYSNAGYSFVCRNATFTDYVELYVRNVVTIVNKRLDSHIDEPYRQSGFWYGIEFCGYAKPKEE
jgi:hypothetical protein